MSDNVSEKSAKFLTKRLWLALVGLVMLMLMVAFYALPQMLEKLLQQQLQDMGYQTIELTDMAWSDLGSEVQLLHVKASGEGLPNILMGKTNIRLESAKLWNGVLALQLNTMMLDGHMTVFFSQHLGGGQRESKAVLENFSIAKLVAAIPALQHYFSAQTQEHPIDGQLWLDVSAIWPGTSQVMPRVEADVQVKNLRLPASDNQPAMRSEAIEIKQLQYMPSKKTWGSIQVGVITIHVLHTPNMSTQTGAQVFPVSVAKLQMNQLEIKDDSTLSIGGLDVLDAQVGLDSKPLAAIENLNAQDIRWQEDQGLSLVALALHQGSIAAEKDALGLFAGWQSWLAGLSTVAAGQGAALEGKKEKSEEKSKPTRIAIQKVDIQGFKINFSDLSKKPVVRLPLLLQSLTAKDVIWAEEGKPIAWQGEGLLGGQGQWDAHGVLHPFVMDQNGNGKLHIQGLELSPLSGYFAQSYGKGIRSGNLDMNLSILVEQGFLKAEGDLLARKVSFSDIKGGTSKTMMPLGSALDILKDGDDNITLQFSSEGKLDDPSYKLSGVWDKVLSKAANKSAMFLVGQALHPYALVLTAGEYLYDQSKHIKLKPIVFVQGDATGKDARPDMQAYAKKIAGMLSKKTSLLLEICPRYTLEEGDIGEKRSLERSQLFSQHLQQFEVPSNRVTNCLPELDDAKNAKPRLELSLI